MRRQESAKQRIAGRNASVKNVSADKAGTRISDRERSRNLFSWLSGCHLIGHVLDPIVMDYAVVEQQIRCNLLTDLKISSSFFYGIGRKITVQEG